MTGAKDIVGCPLHDNYKCNADWRLLWNDKIGLGNWTASTVPTVTWNRDLQMITMGMNYKFGSAAHEPLTLLLGAKNIQTPTMAGRN